MTFQIPKALCCWSRSSTQPLRWAARWLLNNSAAPPRWAFKPGPSSFTFFFFPKKKGCSATGLLPCFSARITPPGSCLGAASGLCISCLSPQLKTFLLLSRPFSNATSCRKPSSVSQHGCIRTDLQGPWGLSGPLLSIPFHWGSSYLWFSPLLLSQNLPKGRNDVVPRCLCPTSLARLLPPSGCSVNTCGTELALCMCCFVYKSPL